MNNRTTWIVCIVLVLIALGFGAWWSRQGPTMPRATAPGADTSELAAETSAAAHMRHPIQSARTTPAPAGSAWPALPSLDASDAGVVSSLSKLAGQRNLDNLLVKGNLIQRIVATVDALPRQKLGKNLLPVRRPVGNFTVKHADGTTVIDPTNFARYEPYMAAVKSADPDTLVSWYVHYYPLFQKAYRQMGYPDAYFNDRVVEVIDNLLATPEPNGPVALTRPGVNYHFANPAYQSLSAGQKMLLRSGPDNEAAIKAKLRAIRADLVGRKLPAATASAPAPATSAAAAASTD
ncbi:MAG TPA: DUF3014 domain-containing protein [Rhodanobacteraceae bacterium]|nr:DUF3014 domain-containing protein [Rhodanobacteraceae bacterium]